MFKKHFFLFLSVMMPVLVYLIAAFISWHPNPYDWGSGGRYVYVLFSVVLSVLLFIFWRNDQK